MNKCACTLFRDIQVFSDRGKMILFFFKPIFGLSDKIGLLVPLEAVQACCKCEDKTPFKELKSKIELKSTKIAISIVYQLSSTQLNSAQLSLTQLDSA